MILSPLTIQPNSVCQSKATTLVRSALFLILTFFSLTIFAATATWKIVPEKSRLSFTATQNGSPVTGEFKKFTGDIQFDQAHLNESKAKIIVDTNSVSAANDELMDTLKTADWLNIKIFPTATFNASQFVKTGDQTYQAKGTLTIRNKSLPVTIDFHVDSQNENEAKVSGSTLIKRNDFGVGQGEWSSTEEIKNPVKVDFVLTATKH